MKKFTLDELLGMPTANPKAFRALAREHGMTTKFDSNEDIVNAILFDGVNFNVLPTASWYDSLPTQGTYIVRFTYQDERGLANNDSRTFRTRIAAERFVRRFDRLYEGEITDFPE